MVNADRSAPRAVLKLGGEIIADAPKLAAVLRDAAALTKTGWQLTVCHGGGPQVRALQSELGLEPNMVAGERVTDEATLRAVKCALAGEVSVDLVAAAVGAGLRAVAVSGVSAGLVTASRRAPKKVVGETEGRVDFGLVGAVERIETELLELLLGAGYTPIVNPLGIEGAAATKGESPAVYNINADTVAAAIALALEADHLFLMTSVVGVLRDRNDPASRIERLGADEAIAAIANGLVGGGMIPKIEHALAYLERGRGTAHILAPSPGALRSEATRPGSRGTALVRGPT